MSVSDANSLLFRCFFICPNSWKMLSAKLILYWWCFITSQQYPVKSLVVNMGPSDFYLFMSLKKDITG